MEFGFLLLQQIISMMLMAGAGYVLGRLRLISVEESRGLSTLTVYLLLPCSLLNSCSSKERDLSRLSNLLIGIVLAVVIHILYLLAIRLLRGKLTRTEQACVVYNNAANLILPIVQNLLGSEYVLYTSPYLLVQNVMLWTHGQALMGGNAKFSLKKLLTTPVIVGMEIGVLLFLTGIRLPGPVNTAITGISASLGAISMFITGIVLSSLDLKTAFRGARLYGITFIRLAVFPLLPLLVLVPVARLMPSEEMIAMLRVLMLTSVGPTASTVLQQAQLYRNPDEGYVSSICSLTTICCVVSIPLVMTLFSVLI